MKETALYILGLCTVFVPNDPVLTASLCRMAHEAQQREIAVEDDWSDSKREWFYQKVRMVVYP